LTLLAISVGVGFFSSFFSSLGSSSCAQPGAASTSEATASVPRIHLERGLNPGCIVLVLNVACLLIVSG
jgi:hypothetical protein